MFFWLVVYLKENRTVLGEGKASHSSCSLPAADCLSPSPSDILLAPILTLPEQDSAVIPWRPILPAGFRN